MLYYIFDNYEQLPWEIVYCNNHTDTPETSKEILISIQEDFIGKFKSTEHLRLNKNTLSDGKFYVTFRGDWNIWQVMPGCMKDRDGFDIPHAYQIRRVGIMFDDPRDSRGGRIR